MDICMVRHGETDWNRIGKLQGREDVPLNQNGIVQAEQCGLALKNRNWDAILTSPLRRARQTADIIADIIGISEVYEDTSLVERDYGKASGLTADERKRMYPNGDYEGMEDWNTLRDRVYNTVAGYAVVYNRGNIIIVSHGGAINAMLSEISNRSIGTGKTTLRNACINMLRYDNNSFQIVFYNKTASEMAIHTE